MYFVQEDPKHRFEDVLWWLVKDYGFGVWRWIKSYPSETEARKALAQLRD